MMKNLSIALFALLFLSSCNKTEPVSAAAEDANRTSPTEISQVQEPQQLQNSKGEVLQVTYFAEGDEVAVKIKKGGEAEQKLTAKTSNAAGNPIFTNDNYMWEMTQEGKAGKLSDKEGNSEEYR